MPKSKSKRRKSAAPNGPAGNSRGNWIYGLIGLVAAVIVAGGVWYGTSGGRGGNTVTIAVKVPALSPVAAAGGKAFRENCQQCHGESAGGSDRGPPLIHKLYVPGHHGDGAFFVAARNGVRAHHWKFGNMPPQPQASDDDLTKIVLYVRELQKANGIY